jgi:virulence-associated protein VapD
MLAENSLIEKSDISSSAYVTVTQTGSIVEIQYMEKMNHTATIRKLNADEYLDLSTGEIKEYQHIENRSQSYKSLRATFKKLRYLINNNFCGRKNELFITLTYKENMTDTKRLYEDMKNFMKRLKYQFKNSTTVDYLSVVEPQQRGAWHVHLLLKFNDLSSVFIPSSELATLWGHGFVKIKRVDGVDNIGAYLTAYLADLELTPETMAVAFQTGHDVVEKEVDGQKKAFIKGGRLHMYPPGMNLFRKSKGIAYPEREMMTYAGAKKIVGSAEPHYKKKYEIQADDFSNTLIFEQYNLKRL